MPNTPTIQRDTLTPELFLQLYRSVGWEAPGIDQVRTARQYSRHVHRNAQR